MIGLRSGERVAVLFLNRSSASLEFPPDKMTGDRPRLPRHDGFLGSSFGPEAAGGASATCRLRVVVVLSSLSSVRDNNWRRSQTVFWASYLVRIDASFCGAKKSFIMKVYEESPADASGLSLG